MSWHHPPVHADDKRDLQGLIQDYELVVLQEGVGESDMFQYFSTVFYVLRNSREGKSTSGVCSHPLNKSLICTLTHKKIMINIAEAFRWMELAA